MQDGLGAKLRQVQGEAVGVGACEAGISEPLHLFREQGLPTYLTFAIMFRLYGLLFWPLCLAYHCEWHTDLSKFGNRKEFSEAILQQHPAANLDLVFQNLTDQGIDSDKLEHYNAFPYFIKIKLSCQNQEENKLAARSAYLQGMSPIVNIKFQPPVNSIYNLPELLEISITAAAMADDDSECLEDICEVVWYVPLPYRNGSVVSEVTITSNKISFHIPDKKILLNVDGYLNLKVNFEIDVDKAIKQFDIGHEVLKIDNLIPIPHKSSPLFYLSDNNPVMILGGVPNRKVVLLSTNEFDSFSILELNIDSCWIASLSCPRGQFSASIFDAIATESMLFIRQNQLMYYYKGNFTLLRANDKGSDGWKRVLSNVCVEQLIPVLAIQNGEEKLFAIGGGKQKAMTYLGTIKDGEVYFKSLLNSQGNTVCSILQRDCLVLWAALDRYKNAAVLLVKGIVTKQQPASYFLINYHFETANFMMHYKLPLYIPKEKQDFVLLVGTEEYSSTPLKPVGITLSHVNSMAYLWGNFLFSSYNLGTTWLAVPKVPSYSFIRYFIHSWNGDFIFMTDNEELWCGRDGYSVLIFIRPSKTWNTFVAMQNIRGINLHYKNETTLTVFYDRQKKLKEHYHVYLASNKLTKDGLYVETYNYRKTFKKPLFEVLPSAIYLDKGSMYNIAIYLTVNTGEEREEYEIKQAWLFAQVSSPKYILAEVKREEIMSSGDLIYKVSLKDQNFYQGQSLSGEDLVLVSVSIKVVNSDFACFSEFGSEVTMEGSLQMAVYVGCPPGNRLALDIAYTIEYIVNKSKVHFDCLEHNEIPCFYYEQPFYPFFLIQDLVTGKSNRFLGR
ncbi:cation channel sperm-associated auxiliary subunit gamma-like [Hemitrygon akajei]|uniref:cation channel sperm-associated auxiliary subunit gamma-like n=1 Tax=Hemitrygon akajei TaxID=2704970 RepID=UPI003BF9C232